MSNELKCREDYSNLSLSCLLVLYKSFEKEANFYNKRIEVFLAILQKYFKDKNCINIYTLLLRMPFKKEDIFKLTFLTLANEFETGVKNPIPEEYKENFFKVLISFLKYTKENSEKDSFVVSVKLSEITTLLEYLKNTKNLNIKSNSLRQEINSLVKDIFVEIEKHKGRESSTSIVAVNDSLKVKEKALKEIKKLRLKKSGLTKASLCDALSVFELYDEEDKEYLISFMIKKNWEYEISTVKNVVAFDYFRQRIQGSATLSEYFNPFKILQSSFNSLFAMNNLKGFKSWMEYFHVETFNLLMLEIEKWYMSYAGATQEGWTCYCKSLFNTFYKSNHTGLEGTSEEYYSYVQKMMITELEDYLEFFKDYKSSNILVFLNKVQSVEKYEMLKCPMVSYNNELCEKIKKNTEEVYLGDCFWKVFDTFSNKLYEYNGVYIENASITFASILTEEQRNKIADFVKIPINIQINPTDFLVLKNHLSNCDYGSAVTVKDCFTRFVVAYFCNHKDSLDKQWVRDVWFNKEIYDAFGKFTDIRYFSGSFRDTFDFSRVLFDCVKDELDFSKKEDLLKVFNLKGLYWYHNDKFFKVFFEKFKVDCPECYNIIYSFCDGVVKEHENAIIAFIMAYFEMK